jgi:tetratricopeptide (TPR) repeat protein
VTNYVTTPCLSDETLAAFAEGRVDAKTRVEVLAHIETCSECMAAVLSATAHLHEEHGVSAPRRFPSPWWLAVAALLVAVVAVPLIRRRGGPVARLVAVAPRSARVIEPRLSGGFAWAAFAGTDRAASETISVEQMRVAGVAGELVEQAESHRDADAQHAAGLAMVMVRKPADAISRLEAAVAQSENAPTLSDLAAARYAAASQLGRASLYPLALSAADRALALDPNLPEALFNRALILERIGLSGEARAAWERYLQVDPSSQWAREARTHLADLPPATRASSFDRDRPLLEGGDVAAVHRAVATNRDRARAFAEAEYLARWAEALQRHDETDATRWLSIARNIGSALIAVSGESLVRDAVHAIDNASPADRESIAAAHLSYRSGRIAYSRGQRDAAERELLRSAELFEAARDPMSLVARYYAAGARLARSDTSGAHADLEAARAAADTHPGYISLGAHVRWELGRALMLEYDWPAAALVLADGAAMFRRSGERGSEAFVETMLAQALTSVGRDDDAWLARTRAFTALSAEGESELLATSLAAAMRAELAAGSRDAALSLSSLELSVARVGQRPELVMDALVNRSMLESMNGQSGIAMETSRQAAQIANGTADAALRARRGADVAVAKGAALAGSDPRAAMGALTPAIDFYAAHDLPFALPEPLLIRARCAARRGDAGAALADLERGIAIVEEHPPTVGGVAIGTGVLDAEHALFADAIRLTLDRGELPAAFAFAERSRGGAVTIAELQRRLSGSGMAVIELVALRDELIIFAVSERDAIVARERGSIAELATLASATLTEPGMTSAATLYDRMIRPVDALLATARAVVFVPDRELINVPFAALYDRQMRRYLVERFAVSIASSAASLQRDAGRGGVLSLAAIALPSGGVSMALPEAEREVRDVASLYVQSESIPAGKATFVALQDAVANADVVHIAGHTEEQPGGGEQALLLAGMPQRVSWQMIAAAPSARRGIVVLAACETLLPPASSGTRAISLGAAFGLAGASDVIGTLAPIGDRDARMLFASLHRQLASGVSPAQALRAAQQEAINAGNENGGRRSWRAVALLTRRIPAPPS